MNKLVLSAVVAAVALSPVLSQAAQTDAVAPATFGANINPNWQDNFFVAGQLGQTKYRTDFSHDKGTFQNVRFGWRWNGIVGPEIGYAYLGHPKTGNDIASLSVRTRALTAGVNAKYNFYNNWFVTGHAGYLRAQYKLDATLLGMNAKGTRYNDGLYAGLGVGYDLTRNFSLGLNYDNYRLNTDNGGGNFLDRKHVNVAAYSALVEYRF
ncbi:outer membrane protein [Dyella choica]|nr:outer membrane beta-barrel protein [Dyella choica]